MVQRLAGAPSFELIKGKLLRPLVRPGTIRRPGLIERLADSDSRSVVSVVAPAGYGKTTLVAQWPERDGQAIAWVSVDEGDNDPKVLLAYIAEALDEVEPVGGRVFDALASPASSVPGSVVPRLCSAFSSMISPVVLVLDDVHLLHNSECRAALSVLADHVPDGSRLVLVGRAEPPVRIGRLRAQGRLLEVGPRDLSLTVEEAVSLLRAAEVELGDEDMAELHRRTEGWPVQDDQESRHRPLARPRGPSHRRVDHEQQRRTDPGHQRHRRPQVHSRHRDRVPPRDRARDPRGSDRHGRRLRRRRRRHRRGQ